MDNLPHHLLQLILKLSGIENPKRLVDTFIESMNSIFHDVKFTSHMEWQDPSLECIEIKTSLSSYGWITINYGWHIVTISKKQLIRNAIDMLAILLENRAQQEKLNREKTQLKKEWIKQSETLHDLDEQYKALAENSEDMILRCDKNYTILYANPPAEKLFGKPRNFLIKKNLKEIELLPEYNEFWINNLQRVFSSGISINENLIIKSEPPKQHYNVKFVPERGGGPEVNHVFATARDITDLKNKEKELYESQWHLKQAQRIAKIGSWEWFINFNKFIFSDELYLILGFVPKGRWHTLEELRNSITEEFYDALKKFQKNPPEETGSFEVEIKIRRADGEIRYCVICGEPIFGSNGKIKKLHGTLQDITDRKSMESDLKNAKSKAEESDKLKSAFLANMSHEIRTPLNGILGFSELLKKKNLTSEKRTFYTDIICSNGKQLLNIISDIIDISRIESGQISIEKSACHLQGMMEELNDYLKTELKAKGKPTIETDLKTNSLQLDFSLLCDEIHLRQVLVNLLSNAVKFTNAGKITFGYEIKSQVVEFFVRDTGIGVKPEYHTLIFERFRQANDSVSREHGGTGLGLAICKNLVELMGGKIWITSEINVGSEFRFQLPIEPILHAEQFSPAGNSLKNFSWPGKKILVVEDDIPSFQLIKETLNETYAIVYHADDGEKAILMHLSIKPDIILMDIRLPKMNGLEAIQEIKKLDSCVPIIAITANAFSEDRSDCKAVGADEYISKPVNHIELLSKIERCLNKELISAKTAPLIKEEK